MTNEEIKKWHGVHIVGCDGKKKYCFCDIEIARKEADEPSEKFLKILWDSGISIPESVQTKEELICWLLDRLKHNEELVEDLLAENKKLLQEKAEHEKDKKSGSICPHGNEKGLCRVCPSISISELNKIVKRSKEQDRQALLEKIDTIVDDCLRGIVTSRIKDNLKQKLKEAVGK